MKKEDIKLIVENKINNSKFTTLIMAGVIVLLILTNWTACSKLNSNKKDYEQNSEAMKKEIKVEKNKNGNLQSSIVAYKSNIKELKNYSKELDDEIKALKGRKPTVIIKTEIVYRADTQYVYNNRIDTIGLDKDEYRLLWSYINIDSTRTLEGNSLFKAVFTKGKLEISPRYTTITKDEIKLDFVVGVVKNKKTGYDEIFVTPKNKNVTVEKLEGAILGKSKLGINLSLSAGYGLYYGGGKFGLGPFFGISISKPLIKF